MSKTPTLVLKVKNVRCIRDATLELPLGSRTVLIGTNNSGKSSLLDILTVALRSVSPSGLPAISASYYRREGTALARPEIEISIPVSTGLQNDEPLANTEGSLAVGLIGSQKAPVMKAAQSTAAFMLAPILLEFRGGDRNRRLLLPTDGYTNRTELTGNVAYLQTAPSIHSDNQWKLLDEETPRPAGEATLGHYANWNSPLSRALRAFSERIFSLRAARDPQFSGSEVEARLSQGSLQNVTPILKWLFYRQSYWREIQAAFSMVFDQVDHIFFEDSPGGSVPFAALRDGFKLAIADMGFGLRNVLQILTVLFAAPLRSIVLIDEPEQGLNQQKQRDFATILEDVRPDITLLCATQAEAFCRGLSATSVCLADLSGNVTSLNKVDVTTRDGLRKIARGMGINPLYLYEGGRILFVEGASDRMIIEHWLRHNFGELGDRIEVQELGGCGKIGEEFARPMFVNFSDKVFFLLDSDGDSPTEPLGRGIQERVRWFKKQSIEQYLILGRREIENYVGWEALASAANIHPDRIHPPAGFELFFDFKQAIKKELGYYDEKRISVGAYLKLPSDRQKYLFEGENDAIVAQLRKFLNA
ncbi:MAG: AAA family ATPase [Polyangiaceae bacterium]|nr:AAA family ATPase [Polyangiaceae bacterium]